MKKCFLMTLVLVALFPLTSFADHNDFGGYPSDKPRNEDGTLLRVYLDC